MELPVNHFKKNILAGKPQIGLWMSYWSPQVVESCAPAGFDWMLLDTEHCPNDPAHVTLQPNFPALPTSPAEEEVAKMLEELRRIIFKACENEPARRYQTAAELQHDLRQLTGPG